MTSNSNGEGKAPRNAFAGVEALSDLNRQFARALTDASRSYLEGIVSIQEELLGLAHEQRERFEKAAEQLPSARYATETIRIQQAWARKVSERYMQEAQRLVELAQETSENSWSPILHKDDDAARKSKS
jgi:hypothetical protein